MTKISVPQQSQPAQYGLQAMNNVHPLPYELHPMQLKVNISKYFSQQCQFFKLYLPSFSLLQNHK